MPAYKPLNPSDRLLELDVLRGLAALSILFFHYTTGFTWRYGGTQLILFSFPLGQYGVHLFFMISGFVIFKSLEKSSHVLDFVVSRFSKIFPCYWCAIILTYLIVKNYLLFPDSSMEVGTKSVLINFSMLQEWFHVMNVDTAYWTLEVELSFYFLMALVLMTKSVKRIEILGFAWLAMMVLNKFFVPIGPILTFFQYIFSYMLKYGNLFFAGILFYKLKADGNKWYRHLGIALCLLVQYLIWINSGKEAIFIFIFLVVIFYLFIFGRLTYIIQKPFIYLGTISYSLYLIHQNIGYIIIQWLIVFTKVGPVLRFIVPLIASVLIATIMTYCIEKPVMGYLRKTYKNLKGRS